MVRTFPKSVTHIGWFFVVPSFLLAMRLVWEQTILTWNSGPQMVGFSLFHAGLGIPFYLVLLGGLVWVPVVLVFAFLSRSFGGSLTATLVVVYALSWGLISVPYGYWQGMFVDKLAHGPHAGEFITHAAAVGNLKVVDALISHGMTVDYRDHSGSTPLHAAAVEGQKAMAEYLLATGADVNAINSYGDSPLENAMSMNHAEIAQLLTETGGKRIRGGEEQREKAVHHIVRQDIEEMEKRESK